MTREEARRAMFFAKREVLADSYIDKAYDMAIKALEEPEPKTGQWIYGEDDSGQDGWTCSECGFFVPWYYDYYGLNNIDFIRDFHTCPHCDAKMLTYTGKDRGGA